MRGEYAVRDILRKEGWECDRVPSSGAAEGFPGDLRATKGPETLLVEVKSRAESFKSTYDLFYKYQVDGVTCLSCGDPTSPALVRISLTASGALASAGYFTFIPANRSVRKLLNLQKLLKECGLLAVRDNNRPFLFIRYL